MCVYVELNINQLTNMKSKHKLSNNLENGGTSSIFKVFVLLSTVLLLLTSCDSNKDKAEALSKQFIEAVNGNDKSTIFDLYPKAQKMKNLFIVKEITAGEIVVEKMRKQGTTPPPSIIRRSRNLCLRLTVSTICLL